MSRFKDDFAEAGFPQFLEEFGEPLSFTRAGADPVPITAIVIDDAGDFVEDGDGAQVRRILTLRISVDDVADLKIGDTVTHEDQVYGFTPSTELRGAGWIQAKFSRSSPVDKTRSGRRARGYR